MFKYRYSWYINIGNLIHQVYQKYIFQYTRFIKNMGQLECMQHISATHVISVFISNIQPLMSLWEYDSNTSTYVKEQLFEFNRNVKQQLSGTAIGTKYAPPYAWIFMDKVKQIFLKLKSAGHWSRLVTKRFRIFMGLPRDR